MPKLDTCWKCGARYVWTAAALAPGPHGFVCPSCLRRLREVCKCGHLRAAHERTPNTAWAHPEGVCEWYQCGCKSFVGVGKRPL